MNSRFAVAYYAVGRMRTEMVGMDGFDRPEPYVLTMVDSENNAWAKTFTRGGLERFVNDLRRFLDEEA